MSFSVTTLAVKGAEFTRLQDNSRQTRTSEIRQTPLAIAAGRGYPNKCMNEGEHGESRQVRDAAQSLRLS